MKPPIIFDETAYGVSKEISGISELYAEVFDGIIHTWPDEEFPVVDTVEGLEQAIGIDNQSWSARLFGTPARKRKIRRCRSEDKNFAVRLESPEARGMIYARATPNTHFTTNRLAMAEELFHVSDPGRDRLLADIIDQDVAESVAVFGRYLWMKHLESKGDLEYIREFIASRNNETADNRNTGIIQAHPYLSGYCADTPIAAQDTETAYRQVIIELAIGGPVSKIPGEDDSTAFSGQLPRYEVQKPVIDRYANRVFAYGLFYELEGLDEAPRSSFDEVKAVLREAAESVYEAEDGRAAFRSLADDTYIRPSSVHTEHRAYRLRDAFVDLF